MVDYSVWDHIEVSDDEDETHPNIDTASLFRWRHQVARVRPSPSPLPGLRAGVLTPDTAGDPAIDAWDARPTVWTSTVARGSSIPRRDPGSPPASRGPLRFLRTPPG